jgi:hypothetical protein
MTRFNLPRSVQVLSVLAALVLAPGPTLFAQSQTEGAIGGVISDQSGAAVPGATINATNTATGLTGTATSDESGHFTIVRLQPGNYAVEVALSGFATFTRNVIVEVGRVTNLEVALGIAGQTEAVTVTAEAPVINRESSEVSTNINTTSLENLPVSARRWSNFVLTTPGAASDGTFGLISFRGISGLLNNNTVDGGDNTQAFFAEERGRTRLSYSMSLGAVQEFQVTTSNYSAEYGRAAGGVVNAVSKSGTNKTSGDLFYFIRDNKWGNASPFTTQAKLIDGTFQVVPIKPDDRRQQFGAAVGGPIRQNKVFYFLSYDEQRRNFPGAAVPANPTAFFAPLTAAELSTLAGRGVNAAAANDGLAFLQSMTGVVERTGNQRIFFPKLDWQISDGHSFAVSYNNLRWDSPAGVQTGATVANGVDNWGDDGVHVDWVTSRLSSVLSGAMTNEVRFQWGRDFEFQVSQPAIPGEPTVPGQSFSPDVSISNPSWEFGKPTFLDRKSYPDERRIQVSDTITWMTNQHLLKTGVDVNRTHDTLANLRFEGGQYTYPNRADFISDYELNTKLNGVGRFYNGFNIAVGPPAFDFSTIDYAAFIQDTWHVNPQVTLNLGLRYDYQQNPEPQIPNPLEPRTNVIPSDKNNLGPRVGLNWDVTGDGNTVLRGGYGVFYGRIINSTISSAITSTGVVGSQLTFNILPTQAGAPTYPNLIANASASPSRPNIVFFASEAQNPMIQQYDMIIDRKIATNTVLSVSYIGSKGSHLPLFIDRNLAAPTATSAFRVTGGPLDGQIVTVPLFTSRPNANFGAMTEIATGVDTTYNALVLALNRRLTNGLQVQTSYTLSKATDNGQSSQTFTAANNVFNPFDLELEEARSNFDVPHRFSFSAVWQPTRWGLSGFTVAPVISVGSGATQNAFTNGNAPAAGVTTGLTRSGGTNRLPSLGRNAYRLPYQANMDLRVARSFALNGGARIEALVEAFNIFNRLNVTAVNSTIYNVGGTAAAPTLTYNVNSSGTPLFFTNTNGNNGTFNPRPREVQFGLRARF